MTADRTHVAALEDRIGSLRFAMFTFRDEHDHLASQPMTKQDVDAEGRTLRRNMGIASLGGATLDNEENYLMKKLYSALGAIQIENQARI